MKVIVTGGCGFIGQHLVFELEQAGHEVTVLDLKISHFHDLLRSPWPPCVGRLFGEDDPMETIIDNAGITALVAQVCGERGIRLAYASTSEIYGDNGNRASDEDEGPFTRPHNLYGISKAFGEDVCEHFVPDQLSILRFSMPYGPGLPAGRGRAALINILHQALHGKKIPIHQGSERSWCYITDTVRAARLILEETVGGAWNVGRDDNPTSMIQIARMACDLTGAPYRLIEVIPAPVNQTVIKRLATTKLRNLGWRPEVELEEGMERTLEWVRTLDEAGAVAA